MLHVDGHAGFLQEVQAPSWWSTALLMVCLQLPCLNLVRANANLSQGGCLRASDILSCTALDLNQVPSELPVSTVTLDLSHNKIEELKSGDFEGLLQLETLRLAHNQLTTIQPWAFRNSSGALLQHLDLSSNQLRVLEQHFFQELSGLRELLLFNNRMVRVETAALDGLRNLHKAYLSHNRLTDFPFFTIQKHSHPHLSMLDLSSNRLFKLPLEDIKNLPELVQKGLYLHNNSLLCECSMFTLMRFYEQRRFASIKHFREEYICMINGIQRGILRFLLHSHYFDKCNLTVKIPALMEQESNVLVKEGAALLLHCITTLSSHSITFFWVTPNLEYVALPGNNGSLKMFPNGSLEIVEARERDSGIFLCVAQDRQQNETWEVNVTVVGHHGEDHEPFNTGFTTLLGCVVSLVLVLMYLYLTPCRCPPCCRARPATTATPSQANEGVAGSAQSSILTPTPPTTTEGPGRKVSNNKHVVFLEPIKEQQNGRLRAGLGLLLGMDQPKQRGGETDSFMCVFSDKSCCHRDTTC